MDKLIAFLSFSIMKKPYGDPVVAGLESLTSPELDDSIAKLDLILEMDGYEALTWEDAVEIISDI